jgi:hypothetical protein
MKKLYALFLLFLLMIPAVLAATSIAKIMNSTSMQLSQLLRNNNVVFGVTFFVMFLLLYGACSAGLRFSHAFNDGNNLNRQGKAVAIAFALLSTVAIYWWAGKRGIGYFLGLLLGSFKDFGGIVIGMVAFFLLYYLVEDAHRDWRWVCMTVGLAMLFAGSLFGGL